MSNYRSYNNYSGVDITPIFQGQPIGEIQAISYAVNREKAAVYTMGKADPRAFSRGKRAIAGSLIFIVFDRHALLDRFKNSMFSADKDETGLGSRSGVSADSLFDSEAAVGVNAASSDFNQVTSTPWYADQIPPFDIVLAAANEYGAQSIMKIYGVEVLNENSGVSIDDLVTEQAYSFVARALTGWEYDATSSDRLKEIKQSIEN